MPSTVETISFAEIHLLLVKSEAQVQAFTIFVLFQ